ncbi:MAG: hypothetical protein MUF68_04820 [Cyclobacteriaceae bacterium]|jgi:glycosyltransferase involved in cell wall biosynthesis|nr:hypothetical protein [Cyclobacteriaceae bacterium]
MQESKKMKMVVASVLKPVTDTRMFEKIANSFAKNGFIVHVLGTATLHTKTETPSIHFHGHHLSERLSIRRWFIPFRIFFKLIKLKPAVLVVASHELLLMAMFYKIISGAVVVYDIRENYALNLSLHHSRFTFFYKLLAYYLVIKQKAAMLWIDVIWLAENCYLEQLKFLPAKNVYVFENKASEKFTLPNKRNGYQKILFTGTLAESTGVIRFIHFAEKMLLADNTLIFTIAGHGYNKEFINQLKKLIEPYKQITLIGGNDYVPHQTILKLISEADFGFIDYPKHTATQNKKATKYFEYAAAGLPVITPACSEYSKWVTEDNTGLLWNELEQPEVFLHAMKNYTAKQPLRTNWFWESAENQLIDSIVS